MTKAAEFLHLSFREQFEWDDWHSADRKKILQLPLAFAHDYEPNKKGWDKKKQTQLKWAYGQIWGDGFEERADGIYVHEYEWRKPEGVPGKYAQSVRHLVSSTRVEEYLQPRVIKNDPVSGFKISHSVSRSSTSNKVWRIQDPRGFELEISTNNMEDILMNQGVVKGEIQGTYLWVGKTLAVYEG